MTCRVHSSVEGTSAEKCTLIFWLTQRLHLPVFMGCSLWNGFKEAWQRPNELAHFVPHAHLVLLFVCLLYLLTTVCSTVNAFNINTSWPAAHLCVCALFSHCETSAAVPGKPAGSYVTSQSLALWRLFSVSVGCQEGYNCVVGWLTSVFSTPWNGSSVLLPCLVVWWAICCGPSGLWGWIVCIL